MKKFVFLLLLGFVFPLVYVNGQDDCSLYNVYRVGSSFKMVHYDKKGKASGVTETTIASLDKIPKGFSMVFRQKFSNLEDYSFENEYESKCVDGVLYVNLSKMMDPSTMQAYENMEFETVADEVSIPMDALPGDQLDDGSLTVAINTGTPVKMTMSFYMTNRQVAGKETITTPAGTFECLKITYDLQSQIGFIKVSSSVVEYVSENKWTIRTETYNKKGKLESYSVIEEINK